MKPAKPGPINLTSKYKHKYIEEVTLIQFIYRIWERNHLNDLNALEFSDLGHFKRIL